MIKSPSACNLKDCFLCQHVVAHWLPGIKANKTNIQFRKGEIIFNEGDQVKGIYFVYSGIVKVHKHWDEKKELIFRFAKAGDMFGYRGLGNEKIYPVSTTAIDQVTVCYIDLAFFDVTLQANQSLTYRLMQFYANELQDAEKRMRNLVHMEVMGRVAETLLLLRANFGLSAEGYINIMLSRQDIASHAGTTYETLFRIMRAFIKDKLIQVKGKKIFILRESALKKLSSP
ncbi:Crp/Fnr family transcriptional regulator [Flavitalea sp.]|nr:Crp/Fnr family transcriptional regulator [Flavitalea sp.]